MSKTVEIIEKERAYDGFFKIDRYRVRHTTPDGGMSPVITRELFERGHAAALLAYDPDADAVLVIDEFRIGRLAAGCQGEQCWSTGPVAGMIDAGELPRDAAIREAQEEAGIAVSGDSLKGPLTVFSSPGGSSEMISLFIAVGPLSNKDITADGVVGEGEFTEPRIVPRQSLIDGLLEEPRNGHLTILLLWLERMISTGEIKNRKTEK